MSDNNPKDTPADNRPEDSQGQKQYWPGDKRLTPGTYDKKTRKGPGSDDIEEKTTIPEVR